jgi:hypothetical protein
MMQELLIRPAPLFADCGDAGRALADGLGDERGPELVVLGLARGGVEVAAEVARVLAAPLDAVAVRKVGHPLQLEYGIGAVAPATASTSGVPMGSPRRRSPRPSRRARRRRRSSTGACTPGTARSSWPARRWPSSTTASPPAAR